MLIGVPTNLTICIDDTNSAILSQLENTNYTINCSYIEIVKVDSTNLLNQFNKKEISDSCILINKEISSEILFYILIENNDNNSKGISDSTVITNKVKYSEITSTILIQNTGDIIDKDIKNSLNKLINEYYSNKTNYK